jgi:ATP synthase protein I
MPATYARIARHSALSAAVVAVVMAAVSGGVGGVRGLLGAVLGILLVAAFFSISVFAVGRAARISPQAMMITAMVSYIAKILILLFFVVGFSNTTAFSTRLFGLSALACILAWCGAQVFWSMRLKFLYVEPRGEG